MMQAPMFSCPKDGTPLEHRRGALRCRQDHLYPVVDGIPVLLRDDVPQTIGVARASMEAAADATAHSPLFLETVGVSHEQREIARTLAGQGSDIDPVAAMLVGATSGHAYEHLIGKVKSYPIPELPLPRGRGERLLDVGCSWGRWSIAAARAGYRVTGLDPSLGALLAARRISSAMGLQIDWVCADARFLPFAGDSFDQVFSYSVLQHFDKAEAKRAILEFSRVLAPGGRALVQMAHSKGIRGLYHRARRRFHEPNGFEVRYWSHKELHAAFAGGFARHELSVHCYFGLGLEKSDAHLMPPLARAATRLSDLLRRWSESSPPIARLADSLYVQASK